MKASNQGFQDLHNPAGFYLVGVAFLVLSMIIIAGALYGKTVAAREREQRRLLGEQVKRDRAAGDEK